MDTPLSASLDYFFDPFNRSQVAVTLNVTPQCFIFLDERVLPIRAGRTAMPVQLTDTSSLHSDVRQYNDEEASKHRSVLDSYALSAQSR